MKEWFTAKELAGVAGMPSSDRNIRLIASRKHWELRKRSHGKGYEYHISSLPEITQASLLVTKSQSPGAQPGTPPLTSSGDGLTHRLAASFSQPGTHPRQFPAGEVLYDYDRDALWEHYDRKNAHLKSRAKDRLEGLTMALHLLGSGVPALKAWASAAEAKGLSDDTLRRAWNRCRNFRREDWLAALVPNYVGRTATAPCDTSAWDFFQADYLRLEKPSANACYRRLKRASKEHGWQVPSVDALLDRVRREIPQSIRVLKREGEQKLMAMYPAQRRTVSELRAL